MDELSGIAAFLAAILIVLALYRLSVLEQRVGTLSRLEGKVSRIEGKVDALLRHSGSHMILMRTCLTMSFEPYSRERKFKLSSIIARRRGSD